MVPQRHPNAQLAGHAQVYSEGQSAAGVPGARNTGWLNLDQAGIVAAAGLAACVSVHSCFTCLLAPSSTDTVIISFQSYS
jgi:hypothetical protein